MASESTGQHAPGVPRRTPTPSIFRRYKWEDLTEPERDAVRSSVNIVATRAAIGVGAVASVAAGIAAGKLA